MVIKSNVIENFEELSFAILLHPHMALNTMNLAENLVIAQNDIFSCSFSFLNFAISALGLGPQHH